MAESGAMLMCAESDTDTPVSGVIDVSLPPKTMMRAESLRQIMLSLMCMESGGR